MINLQAKELSIVNDIISREIRRQEVSMSYKVKEVADMVGISVRTLHHYDQIGILKPETTTHTGYRLYTDTDLERLQQILFFKELDFSLKKIKEILDHPHFDRRQTLLIHKELLMKKKNRLEKIIQSVDRTIDAMEGGIKMDQKEMFDDFDLTEIEKHKEKYAQEAKQKYSHTDAYKESQKRTSKYTKDDWQSISDKGDKIFKRFANLMDKTPEDNEVQSAIHEWRAYITEYFYPCTLEIFRGLGDTYVHDKRFTKNIDKHKEGLAVFMSKAIHYYCDQQGG